jgi:hypothetical protein
VNDAKTQTAECPGCGLMDAMPGSKCPTCGTTWWRGDDLKPQTTDLDRLNAAGEEMSRLQWLLEGRDTFIVEKGLWNEFVEWIAKRNGGEPARG